MDGDTFLKSFDLLVDAPNGVQKLRELILQLAVRGKLVPQDPNDEPASVLLESIKAEKERLVAEGKIKKGKPLPVIGSDEVPYELPPTWTWSKLGALGFEFQNGLSKRRSSGGTPTIVLRLADVVDGLISLNDPREIGLSEAERRKYSVNSSDILVTRVNGSIDLVGSFALVRQKRDMAYCDHFIRMRGQTGLFPPGFLVLFGHSRLCRAAIESMFITTAGQKTVNQRHLASLLVPLPPLAEQKRIVAKVDELMARCDELEKRQEQRRRTQISFNAACLNALTSPEDEDQTGAWVRVRDNFDLLYDTPETVAALRQSILQLAVMGKLVPQDPNDEPASVLLEKIKAEKERLVAEGTIRKTKPSPPIDPGEMPYELPAAWEWVRLRDLCSLITKGSSPRWQGVQYVDEGEGVLFITSENVGTMTLLMHKRKYVEPRFNQIEPRSILKQNDILMNIVGASIGRTALFRIEEQANINQAVCLIRCIGSGTLLALPYILVFLNSGTCIDYMFRKQVDMARANLSMGNISAFPIPVPPLAEQQRIVAKVDELMKRCDVLEANLTQAQSDGEKLMAAAVEHLTEAVA